MTSHVVSLRISEEMKERLDRLSSATNRSSTALAEEALEDYLSQRELEIEALDAAVERADKGDFVSHEAVAGWLKSWGTADEGSVPKPL
jgi:predicted transcriptional regulator